MITIPEGENRTCHPRLPPWFTRRPKESERIRSFKRFLNRSGLITVCRSAGCPNIHECFDRHTATFMILGDICTRRCRFCGVSKGQPRKIDPEEPERIGGGVRTLGIRHAVVTSVTRDDLIDGGAAHFARTVEAIHRYAPDATVEVLVPDFHGKPESLLTVLQAGVQVLSHNVETVPRLYGWIRPEADFDRSIQLLKAAKDHFPDTNIKSGLMLGLGEQLTEVLDVYRRLSEASCDALTLGQYLRPSLQSEPVHEYLDPARFEAYRIAAVEAGIRRVQAGPSVRSSYHAEEAMARAMR